jgi:triacylglycerol lipase
MPIDGDPQSATCKLLGIGCVKPLTPKPKRSPARYPILLVNGIDTSPLFRYDERIVRMMKDVGGHRVFLATLPPYEPPYRRAPLLWERIQEVREMTGARKVNLICHSLGGLDCRYLASPGGLRWDLDVAQDAIASSVASITTIGTAHRGTRIADIVLDLLPDGDRAQALNDFATLVGDWFTEGAIDENVDLRAAIMALSTTEAPAFNQEIIDADGVYYQSWAGYSRPFGLSPEGHDDLLGELCRTSAGEAGLEGFVHHDFMALPLIPLSDIVGRDGADPDAITPNDGLATVASAKWGEFRGCVPADHMEQLGQRNIPDANVRNGFDVARFYANIAADLAARGF